MACYEQVAGRRTGGSRLWAQNKAERSAQEEAITVQVSPRLPSLLTGVDDDALVRAVDLFYSRMLSDERVAGHFRNINMARLRAHQRSFLVAALGDPGAFNSVTLRHAHAPLHLTDAEFDITARHLVASLLEAGVPSSRENDILSRLERVRVHIVAPTASKRRPVWRLPARRSR